MLPFLLYESLPYLYLTSGFAVILLAELGFSIISGLLFITAGAMVWILRSDHRRSDNSNAARLQGRLPFWVYELMPFALCTFGLLLGRWGQNPYFYPSALIFVVIGLQLWLMRGIQRQHFSNIAKT
jgi:hypothetical protein